MNKKQKTNRPCWNCGQTDHWAKACPNKKGHGRPQSSGPAAANLVIEQTALDMDTDDYVGHVSLKPKTFLIYEPHEWLVDTGANVHVCADKLLFVSYQPVSGRSVMMGDSSAAKVLGIGCVDLRFPSGRIISLQRVYHVPSIRRNIISGSGIVGVVGIGVQGAG
ncbi:hypothetical protein OROMI_015822 [Orobanche minor]